MTRIMDLQRVCSLSGSHLIFNFFCQSLFGPKASNYRQKMFRGVKRRYVSKHGKNVKSKKNGEKGFVTMTKTNREVWKHLQTYAPWEMGYDRKVKEKYLLCTKGFVVLTVIAGDDSRSYVIRCVVSDKQYHVLRKKNDARYIITHDKNENIRVIYEVKKKLHFQENAFYLFQYERTNIGNNGVHERNNKERGMMKDMKKLRNVEPMKWRSKPLPTFRFCAVIILRYFVLFFYHSVPFIFVKLYASPRTVCPQYYSFTLLLYKKNQEECTTEAKYHRLLSKSNNTIRWLLRRKKDVRRVTRGYTSDVQRLTPLRHFIIRGKSANVLVTLGHQDNLPARLRYRENSEPRSISLLMRAAQHIRVSIQNERLQRISHEKMKLVFAATYQMQNSVLVMMFVIFCDRKAVRRIAIMLINVLTRLKLMVNSPIMYNNSSMLWYRKHGEGNAVKRICKTLTKKEDNEWFIISYEDISTHKRTFRKANNIADIMMHKTCQVRDITHSNDTNKARTFVDKQDKIERSVLHETHDKWHNIVLKRRYDMLSSTLRWEAVTGELTRCTGRKTENISQHRGHTCRSGSLFSDNRQFMKSFSLIFEAIYTRFFLISFIICTARAKTYCPTMQVLDTNGITCGIIKEILDTHNALRQSVAEGSVDNQPPANNMRELYWDEELAKTAQDWANHCTFAHNDAKDREVARFQVGQNLAMTKSRKERDTSPREFRRHIYNWFNEYPMYQFGVIKSVADLQRTGHYTQLAWASTYLVGCGYSRYKTPNNVTYRLYVCHYGPSGNEIGTAPYRNGSSLNCPRFLKPSKKYKNLCSLKNPPSSRCEPNDKKRRTITQDLQKRSGRKFLSDNDNDAQPSIFNNKQSSSHHTADDKDGNEENKPIVQTNIIYNIISFLF